MMNQKEKAGCRFQELELVAAMPELSKPAARIQMRPLKEKSSWEDARAVESLEKIKESLALAYLIANQNFKNIPLKAFLDGFEKKILLACLRLTNGSQKSAASMLSLKPTALFEKMRKHGIRSCRGRLDGETWAPHAGTTQQSFFPRAGGNPKHASGVQ
jgi:DNA-binding NtrC family response regulator